MIFSIITNQCKSETLKNNTIPTKITTLIIIRIIKEGVSLIKKEKRFFLAGNWMIRKERAAMELITLNNMVMKEENLLIILQIRKTSSL